MSGLHLVPVALALAVVGAAPACAQAMLQTVAKDFDERLSDRIPVSGRTLVGLIRTSGADLPSAVGLQDGKLAVVAGPDAGATICVRATTQDGRYFAENAFARPVVTQADARPAIAAPLAWSREHEAALRKLPLREVAVLGPVSV